MIIQQQTLQEPSSMLKWKSSLLQCGVSIISHLRFYCCRFDQITEAGSVLEIWAWETGNSDIVCFFMLPPQRQLLRLISLPLDYMTVIKPNSFVCLFCEWKVVPFQQYVNI